MIRLLMDMKKYFSIILLIFAMIACSGNKKQAINSSKNIKQTHSKISPGNVKIIGEIILIDNTKLSGDKNSPCSKQPCWASVKIDSVIGSGAGAPIIGEKDTIDVKFAFTLGETTKELFPNLDKRMPGLKTRSKFEALVSKLNALGSAGSKRKDLYQIYTYKLLKL